jgi:hypothetical protein
MRIISLVQLHIWHGKLRKYSQKRSTWICVVTIDERELWLKCDLSKDADAGVPRTGHRLELVEDMVKHNMVVEVLKVSAGKDAVVGQMAPMIIVVAEVIPS